MLLGPLVRRNDRSAHERRRGIQRNLANLQASQAHLHRVIVGETDNRVDLARGDRCLLRVADRRNRHVGLGQARALHGRSGRVVVRAVLTGDADRLALQVSQRRDIRALGHDDRARVGGVVLADRDDVQALRGGHRGLVTGGDHDVFLTGQQRRKEALVRTVVTDGGADARVVVCALRIGYVHGRELDIRDVGQADRDVRAVLGTRLGGCPAGAGRQGQRGARAEREDAKRLGHVHGILLHCVMS